MEVGQSQGGELDDFAVIPEFAIIVNNYHKYNQLQFTSESLDELIYSYTSNHSVVVVLSLLL